MSDFYTRKARLHRRILELVVMQEWHGNRKSLRRIFVACEDNGYTVAGYKNQLEEALVLVNRAITAINAVEGKS